MKDVIVIKVKDIGEGKAIQIETNLEATGADCIMIVDALMRSLHMPFDMTEPEGLAEFGAMLRSLRQHYQQEAVELPLSFFDGLKSFLGGVSE